MEETISLPTAGAIPGIPGEHAAGLYVVDWAARTIRPADAPPAPALPEPAAEEQPEQAQPLAAEDESI